MLTRNIRFIYTHGILTQMLFLLPVIVPYYNSIGLTFRDFLIGEAVFSAVVLLSEVPSGWLSDVWKRRSVLVLGGFVGMCGYALKQKAANAYDRYRQQEALRPAQPSFYEQRQQARKEKATSWDKTYVTKCNASNDLSGGVECRSQRDPRDAVLERLANPN